MISGLLFVNQKGEVLISRTYRGDVSRTIADAFRHKVIAAKNVSEPIVSIGAVNFFHKRHENIYVIAVTKRNANAALVFEFLNRTLETLKAYFGGAFDEDQIFKHTVLVHELLDEIMDFGYPQNLETDILKQYITQKGAKSEISKKAQQQVTIQATGSVTYRRAGIHYRKNEVFVDAVESVNLSMSSKGTILRADVSGVIQVKCYLSGMPECQLGLNDKLLVVGDTALARTKRRAGIELDDVTFHQCVKLSQFDVDRTITFTPPDGEFELMKYRIKDNINLPFRVIPIVREHGRTRIEAKIAVKSLYGAHMEGNNVLLKLPTPKTTAVTRITVSNGRARYEPENNCIAWRIRRFPGETEYVLTAEIELVTSAGTAEGKTWSKPPITLEFQVPMFPSSGLQVRYLRVQEKSDYRAIRWVRYVTRNGTYAIRI